MNKRYLLRKFVQKTLGCTCPDKVFAEIEEKPLALFSSSRARSIVIGRRLLLYIWNVKGSYRFKEDLLAMLEAGKKERDRRGLNRFRAVLAVDNDLQHYGKEAELYFSQYADRDDRMHIHVVSATDVKDL